MDWKKLFSTTILNRGRKKRSRRDRRMEAVEEKMQERRTYYYGGTLEAGKGIPFTGEAVDTVYEMMYGSHIDCKTYDSSKAERLLLTDSDPTVKMWIDVIKNRQGGRHAIDAIEISGSIPAVIEGVRSKYYISDGRFSRLSEENWKNIKPFAEAAIENTFDFKIGHNQATRFYYDILPGLKDDPAFVINEVSTAEGLIPEKAEFAFYIDAEDDIIICEPEVSYGTVTDRLKPLTDEKGDFNTGKIEILAELTRIRQICCDPDLISDDYEGASAKREACIDLVRSAVEGGHKMLLFSQFTSMLGLLEEDLRDEGIAYNKLTGATSKEERMRLVKTFNSDDTPVFLISLKAGGTGLNLTGADIMIHYDPWWNLAAQDQATDRAHRIGQTKDVTVFRLIAKDTIEEKIVKLQETKKELADAVLSGETKSLGSMSKEELLALLS